MGSDAVISIDAMGGDHAPRAAVAGAALAARAAAGVRYQLHGDQRQIEPLLKEFPDCARISEIRHTDTFVSMTDKPSEALRRSRGSSMWNAVAAVKAGEAQVAVSAGNTGALMAISKLVLRMLPNVHRPAIAASWPTPKGFAVVLDVGANVEVEPRQLVEFAIMGEGFHRALYGASKPSVGLLNVGSEDLKGNKTVQEAAQLLRTAKLDLNYIGFVEGDDISMGGADVIVTDGFTGNVALKTAEGTARLLGAFMREAYKADPLSKIGAALSFGALKRLKAKMDPNNVNGGVFLGLNGMVVKSHGGVGPEGFANAVRIAAELAHSDFMSEIARNLGRLAAVEQSMPSGGGSAEPEGASEAAAPHAPEDPA
jgi:glycerol-3-phosphate acyltransferase PlsX